VAAPEGLQREAENSRLFVQHVVPGFLRLVRLIGTSAWAAMHALGVAPRWWSASDDGLAQDDAEADTHAA
jgi:hypothetical protein